MIHCFDTEHEGVVLVANFVSPAAETTTRVDAHILKLGEELLENTLSLECRGGIAVVELAVIGGDNLILGLDHIRVDKPLDAICQECRFVDGLHGRLGNLQHDGPVGALFGIGRRGFAAVGQLKSRQFLVGLGLIVRRIIREDCSAVERAVVLGEV